jgi:hypothetical protein
MKPPFNKKLLYLLSLAAPIALTVVAQEENYVPGERTYEQFLAVQKIFTGQVHAKATEPFVGLTTDGTLVPGLYSLASTGLSNSELVQAATDFLDSLTAEQRDRTMFGADDVEWRQWSNMSPYERNGVGFDEMTPNQRERAFAMMRAALSDKGFELSRDVMRLNHTLAELSGDSNQFSEWFYWITMMGEPSETEPWGWQIDGHHLDINYFVLGDQVVMSPVFFGAEPAWAESGAFEGTTILESERNNAFRLYASLSDKQRQSAILPGNEVPDPSRLNYARTQTELMSDNVVIPYEGISAGELTGPQREMLLGIIKEFVANNREGHAELRMKEVERYIDETWFAWNVWEHSDDEEDLFFYRIHSPVIIIEFDHQGTVAIPGEPLKIPIRQHIHTVMRTPNGNDYGKDLLRQHYLLRHQGIGNRE